MTAADKNTTVNHLERLAEGRHSDPFAFLGRHDVYRCYFPQVRGLWIGSEKTQMVRAPDTDLFEFPIKNPNRKGGDKKFVFVSSQLGIIIGLNHQPLI